MDYPGYLFALKNRPESIIMSLVLGSRPMVGHMTLDHGIGVRIPASQPLWKSRFSGEKTAKFPSNSILATLIIIKRV